MCADEKHQRLPRITKNLAESLIDVERYHVDRDLLAVICLVKLKSGHLIIEDAIVANRNLFDEERGKREARKKVIKAIMNSEMYYLRKRLYEETSEGK